MELSASLSWSLGDGVEEGSGSTDAAGTGPLPYLYFEYRRLLSDHWRLMAGLGWLYVSIEDIEGESLLLELEPLCVATGSACNSKSQEPSYVLRALGIGDDRAQSAIRFSFGRYSTQEEIARAVSLYCAAVHRLRELAPASSA